MGKPDVIVEAPPPAPPATAAIWAAARDSMEMVGGDVDDALAQEEDAPDKESLLLLLFDPFKAC